MMLSCTSAGGLCDTDQLPWQLTGQHYCLKLKYLHFLQPNIQPYVSDLPIHVWNKWMTLCFAENFYFYWSRNLWSATDYPEKAKSYIYVYPYVPVLSVSLKLKTQRDGEKWRILYLFCNYIIVKERSCNKDWLYNDDAQAQVAAENSLCLSVTADSSRARLFRINNNSHLK